MVVIDNVLDDVAFGELLGLFDPNSFSWFYRPSTGLYKDVAIHKDFSFINPVYEAPYQPASIRLMDTCSQVLKASLALCGIELDTLLKIRVNLYTNVGEQVTHDPHVDDHERPIKVGIFYLTTNVNSPTILFNERLVYGVDSNGISFDQLSVDQKVDSVENRFVLFDNSVYHCSTTPVNENIRMNINYNFTIK